MSKATAAREKLLSIALSIAAGERGDPYVGKDASMEFLNDQLAHAARALTEVTDELDRSERPMGWIRHPYPLELKHLEDKVSLRENVGRALGAASTCWESLKGTGVFDSTTAKEVYDELLALIHRETVMLTFQKAQAETANGFLVGSNQYMADLVAGFREKMELIKTTIEEGNSKGYSRLHVEDKVKAVVNEALAPRHTIENGSNN